MSKEFLIQNVRFQARIAPGAVAYWRSDQHTLLYPYEDVPVGSDREPQYTVNAFMRMTFNKPNTGLLYVTGAAKATYAGISGVDDGTSALGMLPVPGYVNTIKGDYYGPPAPIYGSSFRVVDFQQSSLTGNLGQSVYYEVSFYNDDSSEAYTGPIDLDVTFKGALVSSDHRVDD
jgi:hypothetical protein